MTTYLVTASVLIEIEAHGTLPDDAVIEEARRRFFAEIETYKKDEVAIDIFEEIDDNE